MNYLSRRYFWLRGALLSVMLAHVPSHSEPLTPDSWESRAPTSELHDCISTDSALIVPVAVRHRGEAIARLDNTSFIGLNHREVSELLDLPADAPDSGAERIRAAIGGLEKRRRSELEDHVGSWSLADQDRLERLQHLAVDPGSAALRPFLVRGVAKYEGTGAFMATVCRDSLIISHGSLGHREPRSTRLPVIVFLMRAPDHVYVEWGMAE
jgi:hypothetical protein